VLAELSFEPTFEKIDVTLKNSYFEFEVEIEEKSSLEVLIRFELPFSKI
jgi:hypothetical protein